MKLFFETAIVRILHDNGLTLFKWKNVRLVSLQVKFRLIKILWFYYKC